MNLPNAKDTGMYISTADMLLFNIKPTHCNPPPFVAGVLTTGFGLLNRIKKQTQNIGSKSQFQVQLKIEQSRVHDGTTCSGCTLSPIRGLLWECAQCPSVQLCIGCYAGGKHGFENTDEMVQRLNSMFALEGWLELDPFLPLLRNKVCHRDLALYQESLEWFNAVATQGPTNPSSLILENLEPRTRKQFLSLVQQALGDIVDLNAEWKETERGMEELVLSVKVSHHEEDEDDRSSSHGSHSSRSSSSYESSYSDGSDDYRSSISSLDSLDEGDENEAYSPEPETFSDSNDRTSDCMSPEGSPPPPPPLSSAQKNDYRDSLDRIGEGESIFSVASRVDTPTAADRAKALAIANAQGQTPPG